MTEPLAQTGKKRARRYTAPSADAELTAGEDKFARAMAVRGGAEAPPDGTPDSLPDNLNAEDLAAAYGAAWPGRAKRYRSTTIAAKAAALFDAPLIQAAIARYRAERESAPERLDWGRAQRAQAANQQRIRLGLGVREIDSPVDHGTNQTRAKLRADVIGKLHDGGHLRDEHVAAAEEISQLVLAFMRGLFPSSRPLDGTRACSRAAGRSTAQEAAATRAAARASSTRPTA